MLADTAFNAPLDVNVPPSTVPITFALPAFNAVFDVIMLPNTRVTADNVPTLPVLACIRPTIFAEAAFNAPLEVRVPPSTVPTTFALPAFRSVLAVSTAPTTLVTADNVPTLPVLA